MLRISVTLLMVCAALRLPAAEREFDFGSFKVNETPKGFRSTVTGTGKPGDWKIVMDELPPQIKPITPGAPVVTRQAVLAQLSRDPADEHFPLLIFDEDTYGDFTLTTRFKVVAGDVEQMAGVAFRIQDEKNYYYVRASSKGNTFRFFKIVGGDRTDPIGPEIQIPRGVWHELAVTCKGNKIDCQLNGKEVIPTLTDNTFPSGKVGFWTKSDSVSYFAQTKLIYTPREFPSQTVINDLLKRYPRIIGLKVFAPRPGREGVEIIASSDPKDVGTPGEQVEKDVFTKSVIFQGSTRQTSVVTLPIRDRNGDTIAAVRIVLPTFAGQTEQNAIARALPYGKMFEDRIKTAKELVE